MLTPPTALAETSGYFSSAKINGKKYQKEVGLFSFVQESAGEGDLQPAVRSRSNQCSESNIAYNRDMCEAWEYQARQSAHAKAEESENIESELLFRQLGQSVQPRGLHVFLLVVAVNAKVRSWRVFSRAAKKTCAL